MEYPEGNSTAMRCVARKVGLYGSEVVSLRGRFFRTGGLVYDNKLKPRLFLKSIASHFQIIFYT